MSRKEVRQMKLKNISFHQLTYCVRKSSDKIIAKVQ
jgi:hypothetical protein